MPRSKSMILPYLSLFAATFLWASSFIALKTAFTVYDPMVVIFGRMIIALIFILLFLKPLRNIQFRKHDFKYLLFLGFCEPCLYFVFEAIALKNTSASQAGMVTATLPLIVAIPAWFFLKEEMTARKILGFTLAVGGVVLLSIGSDVTENAPNPLFGNFMEFMAMVAASGYIITMRYLSTSYSSLFVTSFQAFIGSIFFLPLLALPTTTLPTSFEILPVLAIIYLGIFVTFGAYGSYNYAISKIPASQATAFINLIPVFTLVMGVLILGDKLTLMQGIAIVIVFLGIYVSQMKSKTKQP
ncbi:MAG: DMT family transporter [Proteobacteria bacterium]|nr:DMT family transporter [Pseudomonadota bacterium]